MRETISPILGDDRASIQAGLEERAGLAAVQAITLPPRRDGTIWGDLSNWAGEGKFDP